MRMVAFLKGHHPLRVIVELLRRAGLVDVGPYLSNVNPRLDLGAIGVARLDAGLYPDNPIKPESTEGHRWTA